MKKFETQADLDREKITLDAVAKYLKADWVKMPHYDIDAMFTRDGYGVGFAEVKVMTENFDAHPLRLFPVDKLFRLLECNRFLTTVIIYAHPDRIAFIKIDDLHQVMVKVVKRKDREDVERWSVFFSRDLLQVIE